MFWLRNKKNNDQLRTLIWGPAVSSSCSHSNTNLAPRLKNFFLLMKFQMLVKTKMLKNKLFLLSISGMFFQLILQSTADQDNQCTSIMCGKTGFKTSGA